MDLLTRNASDTLGAEMRFRRTFEGTVGHGAGADAERQAFAAQGLSYLLRGVAVMRLHHV